MSDRDWLAAQFEEQRPHLRRVAYRMLGSLDEGEDAVQEAWLRLSRTDRSSIDNLGGWLTTVVARVCLDMLRARRARRENRPAISHASAGRLVRVRADAQVLEAGVDRERHDHGLRAEPRREPMRAHEVRAGRDPGEDPLLARKS